MSLQQAQALFQTNAQGQPILAIANQGLAPFALSAGCTRVLALPGRNIEYTPGRVTAVRLRSRESYRCTVLVQSRGQPVTPVCQSCNGLGEPDHGKAFPTCIRLPGHFGGACVNCVWPNHAARCTARDEAQPPPSPSSGESSSDDSSDQDGSYHPRREDSEAPWEGFSDTDAQNGKGAGRTAGVSTATAVVVPSR